jgi:hypothetical protein
LHRFVGTALVPIEIPRSRIIKTQPSADLQMKPLPLITGFAGPAQNSPKTFSIPHPIASWHLAHDSFFMELELEFSGFENRTQQN